MSVHLFTDTKQIEKETELNLNETTMQSSIYLEGPKDRLPILIKDGDAYTLLTRKIEIGNYLHPGPGANLIQNKRIGLSVYDDYFTMSKIGDQFLVYKSEGEALKEGLRINKATAYTDMPYGRFCRICDYIDLELENNLTDSEPFYAYEVDKKYVNDIFTYVDPKDVDLAMQMLREKTHVSDSELSILLQYMTAPRKDLFAMLSNMMQEMDVKAIWFDTKLNIHTVTALPWNELDNGTMYAYFDTNRLLFFSTLHYVYPFLKEIGKYSNYQELTNSIITVQRVGIEAKNLPVGRAEIIGFDRCIDVSSMLTLWRDRSAYQFLAYYIINGIGNNYALEAAVTYAKNAIDKGILITERDMDKQYQEFLNEFIEQYQTENLVLKKYFVGIQAGSRCPYAALPTDYVLHKSINTLRFDCGAQLFKNGILLSGSDQCRSCCLTEETLAVYTILERVMRETVIPAIYGGITGKEAYWRGIYKLKEYEETLKKINMLDPAFCLLKDYNRNIGHTFDKTESCSVMLDKNDDRQLETNMIGCIEFQWPYENKTIGVEDMFFISPEGAINFVF